VKKQEHVHDQGDGQQRRRQNRKPIDLFANGLHTFENFLLLARSAVGGFAHRLQLILDSLQRRFLLKKLIAQSPMLHLKFREAVFDGLKIDRWRRRGHLRVRRQDIRYGGANVPVQQRQYPLDKGQRRAQGAGGALQAGGRLVCGRRPGQRMLWRRRGTAITLSIARDRLQGGWIAESNRQRRSNRAQPRFVPVRFPAVLVVPLTQAKTSKFAHGPLFQHSIREWRATGKIRIPGAHWSVCGPVFQGWALGFEHP
jgi:hypothetical protein